MEEFLDKYMERNGSKSRHTYSAMRGNLRRLERILNKKFEDINVETLKNPHEIAGRLIGEFSTSTAISTILAVRAFLKLNDAPKKLQNEYTDVLNDLVQIRTEQQNDQSKSEEEQENWVDHPDLVKMIEDLSGQFLDKKHAFTAYRNYMLLALFSLMPSVRLGNFMNMRIREGANLKRDASSLKKSYNYLVNIGDGKYMFIFNVYKTSKSVGQQKYIIENPILNKIIHNYLVNYLPTQKEPVFLVNADASPMTQTGITNALKTTSKKLLDKALTGNSFRHIYLSHFLSTNPTIDDKNRILRLIGHAYKPNQSEKYQKF